MRRAGEADAAACEAQAIHHPFTAPRPEDAVREEELPRARALAYDVVYNGVEVGGGSMRIHRAELQAAVFRAIGLPAAEVEEKFGWLLEAFEMGAPPHGGIAFGLDRLAMLIAGARSIRDVIAFPKTAAGTCLLTRAPGTVSAAQLAEARDADARALRPSLLARDCSHRTRRRCTWLRGVGCRRRDSGSLEGAPRAESANPGWSHFPVGVAESRAAPRAPTPSTAAR